MRWLEGDTDRTFLAGVIMTTSDAEQVCAGYRRANLSGAAGQFIIHNYSQRNEYDCREGEWIAHDIPHYIAQFTYRTAGGLLVSAQINFDCRRSFLHHATDQEQLGDLSRWDEAMSIMDTALHAKVASMGVIAMPVMVEQPIEHNVTLAA